MREQRNHKKRSSAQQQSLQNAWTARRNQVKPSRKENTVPDLGLKQPTLGKPVINYETRFRSERRKVQRYVTKLRKQKAAVTELKRLRKLYSSLEGKVREEKEQVLQVAVISKQQMLEVRNELKKSCAETRALRQTQKRLKESLTKLKLASKLKQPPLVKKLLQKGVYTARAREIARLLVKSGCAERKIGKVIRSVGRAFGVEVKGNMSQRTVQRVILEGGIAADVQLGFEMSKVDSLTLSTDGTTHRHTNYESRHVAYQHPDSGEIQIRSLGIGSAVDHTSETQVQGLKKRIEDIASTFSDSPLAKRQNLHFDSDMFVQKLKGMNGDHAADQKKDYALVRAWKEDVKYHTLGSEKLLSMSGKELVECMLHAKMEKIETVGGISVWEAMSVEEQHTHDANMMKALARRLGEEAYNELGPSEKHEMDLFLWAGCCMHKDLNAVKGGDRAMAEWWKTAGVASPVLLANKDNTATLANIANPGKLTVAEKRALDISRRGGVQATTLGGMICRNKDKKKGQQNTYQWYFRHILGYDVTYPDTSNTRYQSHCEAAGEILVHHGIYISFMKFVQEKKESKELTNIEQNFLKALSCPATITELCALALYAQVITHPYMRSVRAEQVNVLTLGPLHQKLKNHIKIIIENPNLVLAPDASYNLGALDGKLWHRPEVIIAIQQLIPSLPHIKPVVTAFFRGALETWERFTSEFCDGSDISQLTEAERAMAFMPSTNDINEGALGTYRNNQRAKPRNTLCGFNAAFTYNMNEGNTFSKKYLSDNESQAYLRRKARELDKSRMERQREKEQVEADERSIAVKKVKADEKRQREQEKAERIAATQLILDPANIARMTNVQIGEQLDVHRQWDKEIPIKARLKLKAEKLEALLAAVSRYNTEVTSRSIDGKESGKRVKVLGEHEEDQEYESDYEMNLS